MTEADIRTDDSKETLAVRAVERASRLLAGRGSSRRRFLQRAAVVGSALAADPFGYVLKPGTAYASVCGSGNSCSAGWSVFCCTINKGANTCPDSSYVAGWWKVDASAFCLGSARYYIDCNRRPGKTCNCRCNTTGCDHRRVCCNVFRYGQCNTHIGGVTEVVCRLVTCTPPWVWSEDCGRTVRTDNETRSHSSSCLPGTDATHIELKYQDTGLVGSVLGSPVAREQGTVRGGRRRRYDNGLITWHPDFGAHAVHGPVFKRYQAMRTESGLLGYPLTDHQPVGDGNGVSVRFENGSIYRHPRTGARSVLARSDVRYRAVGGPRGVLGYPVSHTRRGDAEGRGYVTDFQRGAIYVSSATKPIDVRGPILNLFRTRGGPLASGLGYPMYAAGKATPDGGLKQRFETGMIIGQSSGRLFAIRGEIFFRWLTTRQAEGEWGYPIGHTQPVGTSTGLRTPFEHVAAFWRSDLGVRIINRGPVLDRYNQLGAAESESGLGFPVADHTVTDNVETLECERGTITYDTEQPRSPVNPRVTRAPEGV